MRFPGDRNTPTTSRKLRRAGRRASALTIALVLIGIPAAPSAAAGPTLGWQAALDLQADLNGSASSPQVAMDSAGNTFAVWVQSNGTQAEVWANRFAVGSGWGEASVIESAAGNASDPQVAADELGNAIAVWTQHDGVRDNVWAAPFWVGYGWRTAGLVESESGGFAQHPSVGVDRDGNAIVVWEQFDGSQYTIQANRLPLHSAWEAATVVAANGGQRLYGPQVAVNASGDAVAVWTQSDGANLSVWANRYAPGAGWAVASPLQANATGDAFAPRVALDGAGNATVVWYEQNGTADDIWASGFAADRMWGNATLLETAAGNALFPDVAVERGGIALAVWVQLNGTQYYLASNRFVPGTGWTGGAFLDSAPTDPQPPDLGVGAGGGATAVWTHYDGIRYDVWAAGSADGSAWANATTIEADAGDAHAPAVAVDPSGIAVAVWTQHNATRENARANRFEAPDITPPAIHLYQPIDGSHPVTWSVYILGATEPTARVAIDGIWDAWPPRPDGAFGDFDMAIPLYSNTWSVTVVAMDAAGNQASVTVGGGVYGGISGDLENQLASAQQALAAALDNATALQASLNATRAELTAAQANVTADEAAIAALESQGNASQAALLSAQANLTLARAQVASLQTNVTALNASFAAVEAQAQALTEALGSLQSSLADAQAAANRSSADAAAAQRAADAAAAQAGLELLAVALGVGVGLAGVAIAWRARRREGGGELPPPEEPRR